MMPPFISAIIATRNEKKHISACIESILHCTYPPTLYEVIVVDGMSDDGTRDEVAQFSKRDGHILLIDNPKKTAPFAFNIGISAAKGELIIIMGAHAKYPLDYFSKLVDIMVFSNADCVGGVCETIPAKATTKEVAIAKAVSHPFGVGNAYFRTGTDQIREVDTVAFGCYKKEVFNRIGLFDTDLIRNQDDEFNARIIKNGGKIMLNPEIKVQYYARESFAKLAAMFYQYGYFKPLSSLKIGSPTSVRQLIPPIFVGSLVFFGLAGIFWLNSLIVLTLILLSYFIANIFFSAKIANQPKYLSAAFIAISFLTMHLFYGIGYLRGIIKFCFLVKKNKQIKDMPLSR